MTLTRRNLMALSSGLLVLPATMSWADTAATTTPAAPDTIQDFGIGDVNAKVVIDEYLSFTCPHCEQMFEVERQDSGE